MNFHVGDQVLVATFDITEEGLVPSVIQVRVAEARHTDWVLVDTSDGQVFSVRTDYLFKLDQMSYARVKAMQRVVEHLTERRRA